MSGSAKKPGWKTIPVSLLMTAIVAAVAYYAWIYANIGARTYARGTLLTDLRFFVGLLAVFLTLSVVDRLIKLVVGKITKSG